FNSRSRISASNACPAVFFSASSGRSSTTPLMARMVTPGSSRRTSVTLSPTASTEKPRMSKPMATLATEPGAKAVKRVALTSVPRGRRTIAFPCSASHLCSKVGGQAKEVGKHAAGGHLRPRARALHDQRVVVVARGGEAHHIVGERDVGEG